MNSCKLRAHPEIVKLLEKGIEERKERVKAHVTHDQMVLQLLAILAADPNDIIQHRRNCCRHCYGKGFGWQWRDEEEFERAILAEAASSAAEGRSPRKLDDSGGYGFDKAAMPNPDCPLCSGDGVAEVHVCDTRTLRGSARLLYEGIKVTKDGIQVLMADKSKAREQLMRHLGMFNDKLTLKGDEVNPLRVLLDTLAGNTIQPVKPE